LSFKKTIEEEYQLQFALTFTVECLSWWKCTINFLVALLPSLPCFCLVCIDSNTQWKSSKSRKTWDYSACERHVYIGRCGPATLANQSCLRHLESGVAIKCSNLANWVMNWPRTCWSDWTCWTDWQARVLARRS